MIASAMTVNCSNEFKPFKRKLPLVGLPENLKSSYSYYDMAPQKNINLFICDI